MANTLLPPVSQQDALIRAKLDIDMIESLAPRRKFRLLPITQQAAPGIVLSDIVWLTLRNDYVYVRPPDLELVGDDDNRKFWVAHILEIPAKCAGHVYALIAWMYWPGHLVEAHMAAETPKSGRCWYHGKQELVASNHLDILGVKSMAGHASVAQWLEDDDDKIQGGLYWRQTLDSRSGILSILKGRIMESHLSAIRDTSPRDRKAILAAIAIAEIEELTQVALAEIAEKLDDQDREEVESYQQNDAAKKHNDGNKKQNDSAKNTDSSTNGGLERQLSPSFSMHAIPTFA
ncbi:hypothetical protein VE03_10214 [Pseudogymnoascus sp. 23342-1-I1]|nr:hypothetical protein VE03_10214 [Pseudogymnoascus sp. 23342-1-I1]